MSEEKKNREPVKEKKRPYGKPKIEWEEPFEPVTDAAVSCAKRPGQSAKCNAAPKF